MSANMFRGYNFFGLLNVTTKLTFFTFSFASQHLAAAPGVMYGGEMCRGGRTNRVVSWLVWTRGIRAAGAMRIAGRDAYGVSVMRRQVERMDGFLNVSAPRGAGVFLHSDKASYCTFVRPRGHIIDMSWTTNVSMLVHLKKTFSVAVSVWFDFNVQQHCWSKFINRFLKRNVFFEFAKVYVLRCRSRNKVYQKPLNQNWITTPSLI
jgi:hypothetical protein